MERKKSKEKYEAWHELIIALQKKRRNHETSGKIKLLLHTYTHAQKRNKEITSKKKNHIKIKIIKNNSGKETKKAHFLTGTVAIEI